MGQDDLLAVPYLDGEAVRPQRACPSRTEQDAASDTALWIIPAFFWRL